ncbi:hypothetical protein [Parasitella parasitica]|uniref:Pentacotripeptide-repeat region of PRORP domain-containing protein n=1 Tax=Parasitella parasitica TaxID=35722 RepID=A0A0B7NNN6_9FUNG|nr:hypothetical protein [Parasitella parasitica]
MLPRIGKALVQPTKSVNVKSIIWASNGTLKKIAPLATPGLAMRAFSIQTAKRVQTVDIKIPHIAQAPSKTAAEQTLFDTLDDCKSTGNLKGAIRAVQNAQEKGVATPELFLALVDMLRDLPFDVQECATVAHWFYSADSNLPLDVLEDIDIWKSVLKLGFRFGPTYRAEDLRALVDRFTEIFDLTTMDDQTAWELLMRAYGIMNKRDAVSACFSKSNIKQVDEKSLYSVALLSFAATNSHDQVEKLLDKLQKEGNLSRRTLLKVIRCYGFKGDIGNTSKYIDMYNSLHPNKTCDKTMLLIAHKIALQQMCEKLEEVRGTRGLGLKPAKSPALDRLHASWEDLTRDMFSDKDKLVDITDWNVVLEYLTIANRIDPVQFPMEMAEQTFESYMPANYVKPNDASYRIMLIGYATSQQYNSHHRNVRLDRALEMVSKMQVAGIDTLNHATFHALFRACLPHRDGHYYFDNFRLNSLLPARPYTHNRFRLDPRLFEIEKIMLEAKLPHDRFTFMTLMTCLASGGQYKALRTRWRSLKVHGLRRDVGMYRLTYALASLNPTQAKRAIAVVRHEMNREIPKDRMTWETYTAMLDCCATAQMPCEAQDIMREMRRSTNLIYRKKTHADELAKWPYTDEPNFYLPMLRAAITLPGLDANKILDEMKEKNVAYSQSVWEAVLSKLAIEQDEQGLVRLFNKYTMSRFENEGKIPVPVRESAPVVPFPTAPYNQLDMKFIDVYICSLLDSQNISLVFDVLRTLNDQTDNIGISRQTLLGIVRLAQQEKSTDELKWFKNDILPKVTKQNKLVRSLGEKIDRIIH